MRLNELHRDERARQEQRLYYMRDRVPVARAVTLDRYHTPSFQLVFQLWCENLLFDDADAAMPWALAAPDFIRHWQNDPLPESRDWHRHEVRAHVLHGTALRIARRLDEAEHAYLRAAHAIERALPELPPSDLCAYHQRHAVLLANQWKYGPAFEALRRAMAIARREGYREAAHSGDVARTHAGLGAVHSFFGMALDNASSKRSDAAREDDRVQAAHHLNQALGQLDLQTDRRIAEACLSNLASVTAFDTDAARRRVILTELDAARARIAKRRQELSQFTIRLDWLRALMHRSLGDIDAARTLLAESRARFAAKPADLLYLAITLDLAELERTHGKPEAIRQLAEEASSVLERCAASDGPEIDRIRDWHRAALARALPDDAPWLALDDVRGRVAQLPALPKADAG